MKIFIGPGEVAGYFSQLNKGFNKLGVRSEHIFLAEDMFAYGKPNNFFDFIFKWVLFLRQKKNIFLFFLSRCIYFLLRVLTFIYAIFSFDVFIFSGFDSFFKFYELWFLKLIKKKIIVIFLGSDSRPPYLSGKYLDDFKLQPDINKLYIDSLIIKKNIDRIEKYADFILNHTASAQFLSKKFVRLAAIGIPFDFNIKELIKKENFSDSIRILHAPSRPIAKGSQQIRKIVNNVKKLGYKIEYIELIGKKNIDILNELSSCDFVIDELFSDTAIGMLGTEAAFFAKPTVISGYYSKCYYKDNPEGRLVPSVYVAPENLEREIIRLIKNKKYRERLGRRTKLFSINNFNDVNVANKILLLINQNYPSSWLADPLKLKYYLGWGLSKSLWKKQIGSYIKNGYSLMLEHNPALRNSILNNFSNHTRFK